MQETNLWSEAGRMELKHLALMPWAERPREDLLAMLDEFNGRIVHWTGPYASKPSDQLPRCC